MLFYVIAAWLCSFLLVKRYSSSFLPGCVPRLSLSPISISPFSPPPSRGPVTTGAVHSVAITDGGQLYVWGFGEFFYRQGGKNFYYTPQQVEFKGKAMQASCGQVLYAGGGSEMDEGVLGSHGNAANGDKTYFM